MTTSRRDFLRALAAGTGAIIVPKVIGRIFPPPARKIPPGNYFVLSNPSGPDWVKPLWTNGPIEAQHAMNGLTDDALRQMERNLRYQRGQAWVLLMSPQLKDAFEVHFSSAVSFATIGRRRRFRVRNLFSRKVPPGRSYLMPG